MTHGCMCDGRERERIADTGENQAKLVVVSNNMLGLNSIQWNIVECLPLRHDVRALLHVARGVSDAIENISRCLQCASDVAQFS